MTRLDRRWLAVGPLAALAVATGIYAQQQPPTFRSGAELVRIDATVLDGRGQPVTTLRAEDFSIEENGVPQTIQSFKLVHVGGAAASPDIVIDKRVQPFDIASDDARVFLIFWDEYHIPPNVPARRLRESVTQFLRTMLGPADIVAMMDVWTPMSHLRFTRDHYTLLADLSAFEGRQGVYVPLRNAAEEAHMREGPVELRRAQVSVSALESAMIHMSTLREGRTTVIYLGREFAPGMDRSDSFSRTNDAIRTANDSNVALYSINPDGLPIGAGRVGFLSDLARNTGGEALMSNDMNVALSRAVQQASAYYLLGFSPTPLRHDGKFHKVDVKVKGRGLHVRARNGYWAPSAEQKARAQASAAAAEVPADIQQAFGQFARLERETPEDPVVLTTVMSPDPPLATIAVPEPSLWAVRRPAELRDVLSDTPPAPTRERVFTRTDRLIVRFGVTGSGSTGASVSVALVDRRGKRLTELPPTVEKDGWLIDLPLSSIARGDYVLAVEARAGADRATAYVPLRVKL